MRVNSIRLVVADRPLKNDDVTYARMFLLFSGIFWSFVKLIDLPFKFEIPDHNHFKTINNNLIKFQSKTRHSISNHICWPNSKSNQIPHIQLNQRLIHTSAINHVYEVNPKRNSRSSRASFKCIAPSPPLFVCIPISSCKLPVSR